jgi:zinc transport system substrate-binding protein
MTFRTSIGRPRTTTLLLVPFIAALAAFGTASCDRGHGGGGQSHDHDHDGHAHDGHDHHGHDHDHSGPNPHIWLDPVAVHAFVGELGAALRPVHQQAMQADASDPKPVIVASIQPLGSLVEELAGDWATVRTLLKPGATPHGVSLTPRQMTELSDAKLLVVVGMGLDDWAVKAAKSAGREELAVVRMGGEVDQEIRKSGDQEIGTGAAPQAVGDPQRPRPLASELGERVVWLRDRVAALHGEYGAALHVVPVKQMVTFHNAFDPMAERYGLKVVAHLTEIELSAGGEVTPGKLDEAIKAVKRHKLRVIYAEPQFPETALRALRDETGVTVLRLDPIGNPNVDGYRTWFEMMRSNLKTLVQGQSKVQ